MVLAELFAIVVFRRIVPMDNNGARTGLVPQVLARAEHTMVAMEHILIVVWMDRVRNRRQQLVIQNLVHFQSRARLAYFCVWMEVVLQSQVSVNRSCVRMEQLIVTLVATEIVPQLR
jgi:hypothetical protein